MQIVIMIVIFTIAIGVTIAKQFAKTSGNNSKSHDKKAYHINDKGIQGIGDNTLRVFDEIEPIQPKQEEPSIFTYSDDKKVVETPTVFNKNRAIKGNKTVTTKSHNQSHCDIKHSGRDVYKTEKVEVGGSIAGQSDEGCKEHYDVRFVKVENQTQDSDKIAVSQEDIRKAIILGEVINDPAYKKY